MRRRWPPVSGRDASNHEPSNPAAHPPPSSASTAPAIYPSHPPPLQSAGAHDPPARFSRPRHPQISPDIAGHPQQWASPDNPPPTYNRPSGPHASYAPLDSHPPEGYPSAQAYDSRTAYASYPVAQAQEPAYALYAQDSPEAYVHRAESSTTRTHAMLPVSNERGAQDPGVYAYNEYTPRTSTSHAAPYSSHVSNPTHSQAPANFDSGPNLEYSPPSPDPQPSEDPALLEMRYGVLRPIPQRTLRRRPERIPSNAPSSSVNPSSAAGFQRASSPSSIESRQRVSSHHRGTPSGPESSVRRTRTYESLSSTSTGSSSQHFVPDIITTSVEEEDRPRKVDIACHRCRKRKIRCDGAHPTCGPCASRGPGQPPCEYDEFVRRRGKGRHNKEEKETTGGPKKSGSNRSLRTFTSQSSMETTGSVVLTPALGPGPSSTSSSSSFHSLPSVTSPPHTQSPFVKIERHPSSRSSFHTASMDMDDFLQHPSSQHSTYPHLPPSILSNDTTVKSPPGHEYVPQAYNVLPVLEGHHHPQRTTYPHAQMPRAYDPASYPYSYPPSTSQEYQSAYDPSMSTASFPDSFVQQDPNAYQSHWYSSNAEGATEMMSSTDESAAEDDTFVFYQPTLGGDGRWTRDAQGELPIEEGGIDSLLDMPSGARVLEEARRLR